MLPSQSPHAPPPRDHHLHTHPPHHVQFPPPPHPHSTNIHPYRFNAAGPTPPPPFPPHQGQFAADPYHAQRGMPPSHGFPMPDPRHPSTIDDRSEEYRRRSSYNMPNRMINPEEDAHLQGFLDYISTARSHAEFCLDPAIEESALSFLLPSTHQPHAYSAAAAMAAAAAVAASHQQLMMNQSLPFSHPSRSVMDFAKHQQSKFPFVVKEEEAKEQGNSKRAKKGQQLNGLNGNSQVLFVEEEESQGGVGSIERIAGQNKHLNAQGVVKEEHIEEEDEEDDDEEVIDQLPMAVSVPVNMSVPVLAAAPTPSAQEPVSMAVSAVPVRMTVSVYVPAGDTLVSEASAPANSVEVPRQDGAEEESEEENSKEVKGIDSVRKKFKKNSDQEQQQNKSIDVSAASNLPDFLKRILESKQDHSIEQMDIFAGINPLLLQSRDKSEAGDYSLSINQENSKDFNFEKRISIFGPPPIKSNMKEAKKFSWLFKMAGTPSSSQSDMNSNPSFENILTRTQKHISLSISPSAMTSTLNNNNNNNNGNPMITINSMIPSSINNQNTSMSNYYQNTTHGAPPPPTSHKHQPQMNISAGAVAAGAITGGDSSDEDPSQHGGDPASKFNVHCMQLAQHAQAAAIAAASAAAAAAKENFSYIPSIMYSKYKSVLPSKLLSLKILRSSPQPQQQQYPNHHASLLMQSSQSDQLVLNHLNPNLRALGTGANPGYQPFEYSTIPPKNNFAFTRSITLSLNDAGHFFCSKLLKIMHRIPLFGYESYSILACDILYCMCSLVFYFTIPVHVAFNMRLKDIVSLTILSVSWVIIFLRIIVTLNTCCFEKGLLVNLRSKIVSIYLNQSFFTDLCSLLPLIIIMGRDYEATELGPENSFKRTDDGGDNIFEIIISFLFIYRIFEFQKVLTSIEERVHLSNRINHLIQLFKMLFYLLFISHIFSCFWIYLGRVNYQDNETSWLVTRQIQHDSWKVQYLQGFYFIIVTMISVGYGDIVPQSSSEIILCVITMLISCGVFAYAVNMIGEILKSLYLQDNLVKEQVRIISSFMAKNNINPNLRQQIRVYLEYYQREFSEQNEEEEQQIISYLSDNLKNSLILEANKFILRDSPIFSKYFSEGVIEKLIGIIKEYRYTPEQVKLIRFYISISTFQTRSING